MRDLQRKVVLVKTFDSNGKQTGQGSAVIVRKDLVLTNVHVIDGAASATIEFANGDSRDAQGISAEDIENDLATLSVVTDAPPVTLGDSDKLDIGTNVTAVGNPLGLQGTVSTGIISGFRDIQNRTFIQTSAPISPGSSGGGLFDSKGRLIGVTVAQLTGGQNLNLVVPINLAKPLLTPRGVGLTPFDGKRRMRSYLTDVARDRLVGPVIRVVTRTNHFFSGLQVDKETTYNRAGFKTETIEYLVGKIYINETYDYDTNGCPTRAHRLSTDGVVNDDVYEYDSSGQLVRIKSYHGQTLVGEALHVFDTNGRLVQMDFGADSGVTTFSYAATGVQLEQVRYWPSGMQLKKRYSDYVFDNFGNWIERTASLSSALPGQQLSAASTNNTEFRAISYGN